MTCLVSLAGAPALAQQSALHGIWVGGHPAAEGYVMLRMQVGLDSAADDARASIGIPGRRPQTSPITLAGSRVSFEFDERGGRAAVSAMGNRQLWETSDRSRQYAPLIHRYVPHYFDTTLRWVLVLSNR
jgi:hypothetical protein